MYNHLFLYTIALCTNQDIDLPTAGLLPLCVQPSCLMRVGFGGVGWYVGVRLLRGGGGGAGGGWGGGGHLCVSYSFSSQRIGFQCL